MTSEETFSVAEWFGSLSRRFFESFATASSGFDLSALVEPLSCCPLNIQGEDGATPQVKTTRRGRKERKLNPESEDHPDHQTPANVEGPSKTHRL